MRVLAFTKYGALAASTRQRFLQYVPWLEAAGLTLDVFSLLDDTYLRQRFGNTRILWSRVFRSYVDCVVAVLSAKRYDVIWVHDELFPYLPGFVEILVCLSRRPIVYDFDDAIFHKYDKHRSRLVRAVLGRKLEPLLRSANTILCGNAYLQRWAAQFCDDAVVVPTVVDINEYRPAARPPNPVPTIGWIGSPSTYPYLAPHLPLLETLVAAGCATVTIVGAGLPAGQARGIGYVDWSEATELASVQGMDIGIMPLPNTPWAQGKCGYKLIQYMACGIPVVGSPVGVNQQIIDHGGNGFLAANEVEWTTALVTLLNDAARRAAFGAAGRAKVVSEYSTQVVGPEVAARLLAAARGQRLGVAARDDRTPDVR